MPESFLKGPASPPASPTRNRPPPGVAAAPSFLKGPAPPAPQHNAASNAVITGLTHEQREDAESALIDEEECVSKIAELIEATGEKPQQSEQPTPATHTPGSAAAAAEVNVASFLKGPSPLRRPSPASRELPQTSSFIRGPSPEPAQGGGRASSSPSNSPLRSRSRPIASHVVSRSPMPRSTPPPPPPPPPPAP